MGIQLSGIDTLFYYSTLVLRSAQIPQPQLASTLLGLLNAIMTLVAIWAMERAGRRTLLLAGWFGMCACYLLLAYALAAATGDAPSRASAAPLALPDGGLAVAAMGGVLVCFAIGPGSVAWFVVAEIFPPHAREAAMALGVVLNWSANSFVAFSFPTALELLGPRVFLLFAASTAAFGAVALRCLPETKNKHVDDITWEFGAAL